MAVSKEDALELAMSAKINFESVAKMMPAMNSNPIYSIAKAQLDELVNHIEAKSEVVHASDCFANGACDCGAE